MLQPYIEELMIDKIPVTVYTRVFAFLERNIDNAEILDNLGATILQHVLKQFLIMIKFPQYENRNLSFINLPRFLKKSA